MEAKALDSGSGPAALFLHGQPGSAADWSPVMSRLRERMRTIAPDRPGYGGSGAEATGFHGNAVAAVELLDRLALESVVVTGHSWGAGVALAMAIQFPRRVEALVLVGPVIPAAQPGLIDRFFAHRLFGPPAARLGFLMAGLGLSLPVGRRLAHAAVPAMAPDRLAATAAEWRKGGVWQSFYAEQRALVDELPALVPGLASIQAPVTLLRGRHDRVAPRARIRALVQRLPNAELVEADGGHLLPQQRPRLVAEAVAAAAGQAP